MAKSNSFSITIGGKENYLSEKKNNWISYLIVFIACAVIICTGAALILLQKEYVIPGKDGSVVLLGDSLINVPYSYSDLAGKLARDLPNFQFGISNNGENSDKILDIKDRLFPILLNIKAITGVQERISNAASNKISKVIVILFWDSDISDIDEVGLSSDEINTLRINYENNLISVTQDILNIGAYMAMSGPGTLPNPAKTDMLEAYKAINMKVANSFNMPYIDLRTAFLNELAAGRSCTSEGEHPNDHGAEIMAQIFTTILSSIVNVQSDCMMSHWSLRKLVSLVIVKHYPLGVIVRGVFESVFCWGIVFFSCCPFRSSSSSSVTGAREVCDEHFLWAHRGAIDNKICGSRSPSPLTVLRWVFDFCASILSRDNVNVQSYLRFIFDVLPMIPLGNFPKNWKSFSDHQSFLRDLKLSKII
eukprot:gene4021-8007_t